MSLIWCKAELEISNFGLNHPEPGLFVTSQWPWYQAIYLAYRLFFAAFFVVWTILGGTWKFGWYTTESNRIKWFIYITNWGFLILTLSVVVQAVLVMYAFCRRHSHTQLDTDLDVFSSLPWYLKFNWVLYNISTNTAFIVTLLFWILIYKDYEGRSVPVVDVMEHAANSVYVILDLMVAGTPVRIYHAFHGVIFGAVYITFSIIYDVSGGTNAMDFPYIYEVIDWSDDLASAALYGVLMILLLSPLMWLLVYALYCLRLFIYTQAYGQ